MKARITILILALAWLFAPTAASAGPPFSLCNRTSKTVYVAIAYYADNPREGGMTIKSEGWWTIAPGQCKQLFNDESIDGHRYYHANSADWETEWKGNMMACVQYEHAFELQPASGYTTGWTCPPGWNDLGFKKIGRAHV